MKTIINLVAGALVLLGAAQVASAQQRGFFTRDAGPYFRVGAGVSLTEEGRVTKFTPGTGGGDIDFDPGYNVNMAVGYAANRNVAIEFEFGATDNEIDSVQGIAVNDTFLFNAPFLVNVVFQYTIPRTIVTPYLGLGGGGSATVFDTDSFSNGAATLFGSDSDVVFAWQAFAGVRFELNEQMSVGAGYKYFATEDTSFEFDSLTGGPDAHLGIQGVRSHVILFVFNMKF